MKLKDMAFSIERALRAHLEVPKIYKNDRVLLCSFPKSGNTWLRFIFANIAYISGGFTERVDFHSIDRYAPTIRGNRRIDNVYNIPECPLMLKTHFPWIRQFEKYPSLLVVRNPEDVMVSYFIYMNEEKGKCFHDISSFIRHWRYGIPAWVNYHSTWIGRANAVVRYENILDNAVEELMKVLQVLGYYFDENLIRRAVKLSTKRNMRVALMENGDPHARNPNFQFVRNATKGEGRSMLSMRDIEYVVENTNDIMTKLHLISAEP